MGGQNSLLAFLFLFLLTLLPCKGWAYSWTDPSKSGLVLVYADEDDGVRIMEMTTAPTDGNVVIPSKINGKAVIKIADGAFAENTSLKSIFLPALVKTIGNCAFLNCTNLSTFTVADNPQLKSIGMQAFMGCSSLEEITIPASVETIAREAFADCKKLNTVTMLGSTPCKLVADGYSVLTVFRGCPLANKIHVPEDAISAYKSDTENGWSDYKDYIYEPTAGSTITVGNYTYELNADGENTVTLVKVENVDSSSDPISFPETFEKDGTTYTVTQIGNGDKIFSGTRSIYASADAIPNTVNTIGANAFDGIYFRDGAVIPASVKYIGDGAFVTHYSESNVGSSASIVTLKSKSAFAVGEKIFGEQFEYEFSIIVSEDLLESFKATTGWDTYKDYFISEIVDNGLRYRKYQNQEGSTLSLVGFDEESTVAKDKVVVPAEVNGVPVTYIEQNAFKGKTSLTSLDLSQATNLKVIDRYAFMQTSLTEVVIPENVTSICPAAFGNISTLKKVTLYPTDITPYDSSNNPYWMDQFANCSNLEDVWVPKGTKSTYLKLFGSMTNKDEIIKEMDNSITSDNLKYELNADGETVTVLGLADDADVEAKENVEIPATIKVGEKDCKVTAIADNAFNSLNTKQVTVGENVTKIGAGGLSAPGRVIFKGANAPELGDKALGESYNWGANNGCYIMVPANSMKAYREASTWSNYKDAVMAEPFVIDGGVYSILDNDEHTVIFIGYTGDETEYTIPSRIYNSASGYSYDVVSMKHVQGYGISSGVKKLTIPETIKSLERGALDVNPEGNLKEIDFLCENPTSVSLEMTHLLTFIDAFYVHSQEALEMFQASVELEELKPKIQLAAKPISDGIYKYQLNEDDQTVTVVGIADGVTLKNEIWVFGNVGSYQVTGIAANVFSQMSEITHIHVPSSVSTISANAFAGMTSGLKVTFDRTGDISAYSKEMFGTTEVSSINVPTESYAAYYAQLTNDQEDENKIGISSSLADGQGVENLAQGLYPEGELKYTRTITEDEKGGYITTCLPFNINLSDAKYEGLFAGVWTFTPQITYKEDGRYYIDLQKIEGGTVAAGTPMLLKLNADVAEVSFYNAEALKNDGNLNVEAKDATVTGKTDVTIQYSGTYMKKSDCESVYSFNVDATFGKHNGSALNPFRAYLTIVDASGNAVQNASFYSSLNPGGGTTGINGVAADTVGTKAAIYSIDGKLVRKAGDSKSLAKGVYVIGGKKLVVK